MASPRLAAILDKPVYQSWKHLLVQQDSITGDIIRIHLIVYQMDYWWRGVPLQSAIIIQDSLSIVNTLVCRQLTITSVTSGRKKVARVVKGAILSERLIIAVLQLIQVEQKTDELLAAAELPPAMQAALTRPPVYDELAADRFWHNTVFNALTAAAIECGVDPHERPLIRCLILLMSEPYAVTAKVTFKRRSKSYLSTPREHNKLYQEYVYRPCPYKPTVVPMSAFQNYAHKVLAPHLQPLLAAVADASFRTLLGKDPLFFPLTNDERGVLKNTTLKRNFEETETAFKDQLGRLPTAKGGREKDWDLSSESEDQRAVELIKRFLSWPLSSSRMAHLWRRLETRHLFSRSWLKKTSLDGTSLKAILGSYRQQGVGEARGSIA